MSDAEGAGGACGLSFRADTPVATSQGEQAIGTLEVGEKVWAYNPQAKKMELEPIQHIWLNHDNDLVDLTLTAAVKGSGGKTTQKSEVIHTNERHPFLTKEKGFIPVSQLKPGVHVMQADGSYGVVAKLVVVPGAMWMYNLTVNQDHTYVVGVGQWIVHNTGPCLVTDDGHIVGRYNDVAKVIGKGTGYQLHHIIQWASLRGLPGATYDNTMVIGLFGGVGMEDSEHWAATQIQKGAARLFAASGATSLLYSQARNVAEDALGFAGLDNTSIQPALNATDADYMARWTMAQLNRLRVPLPF